MIVVTINELNVCILLSTELNVWSLLSAVQCVHIAILSWPSCWTRPRSRLPMLGHGYWSTQTPSSLDTTSARTVFVSQSLATVTMLLSASN